MRIFQQANATAFEFFFRFPFAEADTFKDRTLKEEDVPKVVCEILEVQTKSKTFGRVLGLPKVTVDSIHLQHIDPQECLISVLDEFVKQVEPPPTWRVILEALRNPLISQHRLAQEIESKYCPHPQADDGTHTLCPLCMNCLNTFSLHVLMYAAVKLVMNQGTCEEGIFDEAFVLIYVS